MASRGMFTRPAYVDRQRSGGERGNFPPPSLRCPPGERGAEPQRRLLSERGLEPIERAVAGEQQRVAGDPGLELVVLARRRTYEDRVRRSLDPPAALAVDRDRLDPRPGTEELQEQLVIDPARNGHEREREVRSRQGGLAGA